MGRIYVGPAVHLYSNSLSSPCSLASRFETLLRNGKTTCRGFSTCKCLFGSSHEIIFIVNRLDFIFVRLLCSFHVARYSETKILNTNFVSTEIFVMIAILGRFIVIRLNSDFFERTLWVPW